MEQSAVIRLERLGIKLPEANNPAGNYANYVISSGGLIVCFRKRAGRPPKGEAWKGV